MISQRLLKRYYPDERRNGTLGFYDWVRRYTHPGTLLLNLGAGPATGTRIRSFRGEVARVVGADIDPIVRENDELDEAHVLGDETLPFPDNSFDVVLSDFVLEHVGAPEPFLCQAYRALKPGGSFFFRTPNKHHYVSLIARLTPHSFHQAVANRVRGMPPEAHEPWRTFYRLNDAAAIRRLAGRVGFRTINLRFWEAEPSYLMFHSLPFLIGVAYERMVNRTERLAWMRANIFGRLEK